MKAVIHSLGAGARRHSGIRRRGRHGAAVRRGGLLPRSGRGPGRRCVRRSGSRHATPAGSAGVRLRARRPRGRVRGCHRASRPCPDRRHDRDSSQRGQARLQLKPRRGRVRVRVGSGEERGGRGSAGGPSRRVRRRTAGRVCHGASPHPCRGRVPPCRGAAGGGGGYAAARAHTGPPGRRPERPDANSGAAAGRRRAGGGRVRRGVRAVPAPGSPSGGGGPARVHRRPAARPQDWACWRSAPNGSGCACRRPTRWPWRPAPSPTATAIPWRAASRRRSSADSESGRSCWPPRTAASSAWRPATSPTSWPTSPSRRTRRRTAGGSPSAAPPGPRRRRPLVRRGPQRAGHR